MDSVARPNARYYMDGPSYCLCEINCFHSIANISSWDRRSSTCNKQHTLGLIDVVPKIPEGNCGENFWTLDLSSWNMPVMATKRSNNAMRPSCSSILKCWRIHCQNFSSSVSPMIDIDPAQKTILDSDLLCYDHPRPFWYHLLCEESSGHGNVWEKLTVYACSYF